MNLITRFLIGEPMPPIAYFTAEIGLWSELTPIRVGSVCWRATMSNPQQTQVCPWWA